MQRLLSSSFKMATHRRLSALFKPVVVGFATGIATLSNRNSLSEAPSETSGSFDERWREWAYRAPANEALAAAVQRLETSSLEKWLRVDDVLARRRGHADGSKVSLRSETYRLPVVSSTAILGARHHRLPGTSFRRDSYLSHVNKDCDAKNNIRIPW